MRRPGGPREQNTTKEKLTAQASASPARLKQRELAVDFDPDLVGCSPADAAEAAAVIGRFEDEQTRFDAACEEWYENHR